MSSLRARTLNGVNWSLIDIIVNTGISFIVGIILARILSPSEFGIIGMLTVFIAISNSIVDSGFSNALIRKKDAERIDYNTVFFFNVLLGTVLFIILFVCAPAISIFFREPLLLPVTRVMGITLVINSFAIIQRTLLVKKINFKTQAKISLISSLASGIAGITMAFAGLGVWSLVGQLIIKQLLNTILLWFLNTWRPVFEFSGNSFKELFGFGSKLLISGLIDTLYKNIYYLIIGKFYSSSQLGQYTRAEQFNNVFSSTLTSVVQRVSYPVLSSIQDENERLKMAYRRIIKTTMLITFACMMALAAIAKPLILILIGKKWLPAVVFLQIICFAGMLYPLHAINLNILQVKGRSDLFLKLEIIKKIIGVLPIALGIFYGIEVMLWASVSFSFVAFFLNSFFSSDLIKYSTISQVRDILPTFLVSLIVSAGMWSLTLFNLSVWITLIIQLMCGFVFYLIIYELIRLPEFIELKDIINSKLKTAKTKYV
jgi:O-antigen/teichoic acid export membrane protein